MRCEVNSGMVNSMISVGRGEIVAKSSERRFSTAGASADRIVTSSCAFRNRRDK